MTPHDVVDVSDWPTVGGEPLGSKTKVWLQGPDGFRWLFKVTREFSGDDWAERIAADLGLAIDMPCPAVELAWFQGQRGSITRRFLHPVAEGSGARLVHGNEFLYRIDPAYPTGKNRRVSQHTVGGVLDALQRFEVRPPEDVLLGKRRMSATEVFVGYLAFDAWIGNQDRHHENWGVVSTRDTGGNEVLFLAPSFDHAASLGQILRDEERLGRLETSDHRYSIRSWAPHARAHLYLSGSESKPAYTRDAFACAARRHPEAGEHWRRRIAEVKMSRVAEIVAAVPDERMSEPARRFVREMLAINRDNLTALDLS